MRVISIAGPQPAVTDNNEESGVIRKVTLPLARREFLTGSGILFGALATGTLLASLAPSNAWALEPKKLSTTPSRWFSHPC